MSPRLSLFALITLALAMALTVAACKQEPRPVQEVLDKIDAFYGQRIAIRTKLRSGARCRVAGPDGEFKTYCKDCQYCDGPYIVDPGTGTSTITHTSSTAEPKDWPMILGGSHDFKAIRCKGELNEIQCYPFELGKEYILRGILERHHPPRIIVDEFEPAP